MSRRLATRSPSRPASPLVAALAALLTIAPWATRTEAAELPDSLLAEARRQYAAQEYERVIQLVRPVTESQGATNEQRTNAYELLGLSSLILGQEPAAREAFEQLLRLDRKHVLQDPSGSPKLKRFFESVRASLEPPPAAAKPALEETEPPDRPRAGRTATFGVRALTGGQQVRWMVLHYRRDDHERFNTVTMTREGEDRYVARPRLPEADADYRLAYYFEARDRTGVAAATAGTADEPLTLLVRRTPGRKVTSTPFYKRWWFWTLVGAAAAGGATAAILLAGERAPEGNLPPHIIQLPLGRF